VIVLDTTVLVYAMGRDHAYRDPCRALIAAVAGGDLDATTTVEAVQEFVHVRARRRERAEAAQLGRDYASLLAPLLAPSGEDLRDGLALFERDARLGAFDAVLAAAAVNAGVEALVSADNAFAQVPGLAHVVPEAGAVAALIAA
jgi:predicted nucleic acid-binding protein